MSLTVQTAVAARLMDRRTFLCCVLGAAVGVGIVANFAGDLMDDTLPLGQRVTFGAYAENEPWPDLSAHYALEKQLGIRLPVMSWFQALDSGWLHRQADDAASTGHDLLICLQPSLSNRQPVPFTQILNGDWDRRLNSLFTKAAAYPHQVTIRFAHEMNLAQLPHSIANPNGNTRDLDVWLDTWRYIVDRQRSMGGDNIRWQWCVSGIDMGGVAAEAYWPGADYVDSLGMDTYNGFGPWTSGVKLITPMYNRITALHPTAEVWMAEIGCREVGNAELGISKAAWFAELFASTAFPRMSTICFFHSKKERDWRLTNPAVLSDVSSTLRTAVAARIAR